MQESVWDPERISNIGWLLSRYSEHLQPSDRIKLGIEGDPCGAYRGVEDAPTAIVSHVSREDSGFVRFTAVLEDSNVEVELDNRNVSPDKVWEIHPDFVDTFRGRVHGDTVSESTPEETHEDEKDAEPEVDEMRHLSQSEEGDDDFRSSVKTHVESLDERLKRMETAESELERTIASAVRELAGDLMRTYRGEEPEFAYRYADRYDLALTRSATRSHQEEDRQDAEKEDDEHTSSEFRGGHETSSRRLSDAPRSKYQDEKDSFDLESLSFDVKESSVLSD